MIIVSELLLLALLAGCSSPEPPSEQKITEVLDDARRDLVFVEGGEFWLGDVGNEAGVPFNPLSDDNKPPKCIELDGFSILKTEVTWGDFVTFLRDVGRAEDYTTDNGFTRAVSLPII